MVGYKRFKEIINILTAPQAALIEITNLNQAYDSLYEMYKETEKNLKISLNKSEEKVKALEGRVKYFESLASKRGIKIKSMYHMLERAEQVITDAKEFYFKDNLPLK